MCLLILLDMIPVLEICVLILGLGHGLGHEICALILNSASNPNDRLDFGPCPLDLVIHLFLEFVVALLGLYFAQCFGRQPPLKPARDRALAELCVSSLLLDGLYEPELCGRVEGVMVKCNR